MPALSAGKPVGSGCRLEYRCGDAAPLEQKGRELRDGVGPFVVTALAVQAAHHRQRVAGARPGETGRIDDPSRFLDGPTVLVTRLVLRSRSPHAEMLHGADIAHLAHDVVAQRRGKLVE